MVAAAEAVAADGAFAEDDVGVVVAGFEDGGAPAVVAEVFGSDPVAQERVSGGVAVGGEVGVGAEVEASVCLTRIAVQADSSAATSWAVVYSI